MLHGNVKLTFASRLKLLREEKELSQVELGEKLGVSRGSISFYENADRTPDIEFLDKVSLFFDVPLDYLMGYTDNKKYKDSEILSMTGLSDKAIDNLIEDRSDMNLLISSMLENEKFIDLMWTIEKAIKDNHLDNLLSPRYQDVSTNFILHIIATRMAFIFADVIVKNKYKIKGIDIDALLERAIVNDRIVFEYFEDLLAKAKEEPDFENKLKIIYKEGFSGEFP